VKTLSLFLVIFSLCCSRTSHASTAQDFTYALLNASSTRVFYTEWLQSEGMAPQSLGEMGLNEPYFQNSLIEHVDIDPTSGALMFGLSPIFGQNEWLTLIPKIENYSITEWTCQTTVDQTLTGNNQCRPNVEYEHLTKTVDTSLFDKTLVATARIKVNAAETYQEEARFTQRLDQLGIDEQWLRRAFVDHVIVEPKTKSILFGLSEVYGINQWLVLTAVIDRYGIRRWNCKTSLPRSMVNAGECQINVANENLLRPIYQSWGSYLQTEPR